MKGQILKLRSSGKTYNEIIKELGCSKGTVSYYCGEGQKTKTLARTRKRRTNPVVGKLEKFLSRANKIRVNDFQRNRGNGGSFKEGRDYNFTVKDAIKKFGHNPICYLTGRRIDLLDSKSYHFDHIIPVSKGGKNTLSNLGLLCREANYSKSDMMVDEYLQLCKEVIEYSNRG
jgi:5-methylcytosine-specific restriction endonuclease McrA